MKRLSTFSVCCLFLFSGILLFSGSSLKVFASQRLGVYVVNYPLMYFAERIGGSHVEVTLPAPPDVDPAYWSPGLDQISNYQKADIILLNGAGYAKWVRKASLPRSRMVDTSRRFKDQYIMTNGLITHSHGAGGEHAHESLAFTTWLDFSLAARQAQAIAAAMERKRPSLRHVFLQNLAVVARDLEALDRDLKTIVSKRPDTPLIVSHPVYDYLARRYGLNIVSVHWEPDQVPGPADWIALKKIRKGHPAQWMVWEGEPVQESVDRLENLGVNSLVFNPCGNRPRGGDFLSVMRRNVENLKPAFQ